MASFSRSQKLQLASVAQRIAALQAKQKAEAERSHRVLKEKQARELAELGEQLRREVKALEVEEEKRRKAAERKRREAEVREAEMQRQKRARALEMLQYIINSQNGQAPAGPDLSTARSGGLKRKRGPAELDGSETRRKQGGGDTEEERAPKGRRLGEPRPAQSTRGVLGSQNRCVSCAKANVECSAQGGRRSCKRCVKHRKKCVPEEKNGDQSTSLIAAIDKCTDTIKKLTVAEEKTASLLQNLDAPLRKLVELGRSGALTRKRRWPLV